MCKYWFYKKFKDSLEFRGWMHAADYVKKYGVTHKYVNYECETGRLIKKTISRRFIFVRKNPGYKKISQSWALFDEVHKRRVKRSRTIWLTVKEYAEKHDMPADKVYRMAYAGCFMVKKINNRLLIHKNSYDPLRKFYTFGKSRLQLPGNC